MTRNDSSLGTLAHRAIARIARKLEKHRQELFTADDPEVAHQARVALRRLQAAADLFDPALELPRPVRRGRIRRVREGLGRLRDLDIAVAGLAAYRDGAGGEERDRLDGLLPKLEKRRRRGAGEVAEGFGGRRFLEFTAALAEWLERPAYRRPASRPVEEVLPDLLSPVVAGLFLHSGWWVAPSAPPAGAEDDRLGEELDALLRSEGPEVHDLRQRLKTARYQLDLFAGFYPDDFRARLGELREMQDALGALQDVAVIREVLLARLGDAAEEELPSVYADLRRREREAWLRWDGLRTRYLDPGCRREWRLLLLAPHAPLPSGESSEEPAEGGEPLPVEAAGQGSPPAEPETTASEASRG